jgi:hypothetical protein
MRTAKLADESADGLLYRGRDEVELTGLDAREIVGLFDALSRIAMRYLLTVATLLFVALSMGMAQAHALELPPKME